MDGRQSYEVIHKGGLMESETETENYKNTSMPPSARLEENKKKEPFSSAAAGSLSAAITGTSSPECAVLAGSQSSVSQAGLPPSGFSDLRQKYRWINKVIPEH